MQDFSGLSNRFSCLEIEDTEDIAETSQTLQSLSNPPAQGTKKAPAKKPSSVDVFELDYDDEFDRMFDVFCFFEDLHRIQDFLTETWTKVKHGKLDVITASITTNAAFDLVRREEQALTADLFGSSKKVLSYSDLAALIFYAESLRTGTPTSPRNRPRITPFDNFVFLPIARSILKFSNFLEIKAEVSISTLRRHRLLLKHN